MIIIALGLVCWFATYLIVESEFFRPLRDWVVHRESKAKFRAERAWRLVGHRFWKLVGWFWGRVHYLVECHTCTGTWVGLTLAPFAPAVFGSGVVAFVLVALLIKAIGHLVLVVHKYLEAVTERKDDAKVYSPRDRAAGSRSNQDASRDS